DLCRLQLLQPASAECRNHMAAQELAVTFERPAPNPLLAPARRAEVEPLLHPLRDGDPAGRHVRAIIAGLQQRAQLLLGLRLGTVDRFRVRGTLDAIAQPPSVRAALVNAAVAFVSPFAFHLLVPLSLQLALDLGRPWP